MFAQYINTCPLVVDRGVAYADIDVNIAAGASPHVSLAWKGQNKLLTLVIFSAVIDQFCYLDVGVKHSFLTRHARLRLCSQ